MTEEPKNKLPDLSALRITDGSRSAAGRKRKSIIVIICIAAASVLTLLALLSFNRTIQVEVAVARPASASRGTPLLNASGYVTPRRRATVAAKITGRIRNMLVEEGQRVAAGQIIAQLDDAEARSRYAAAHTELQVAHAAVKEIDVNIADAERTLRRVKRLQNERVASTEDRDRAQAIADALRARKALAAEQVKAAQARLEVAGQELENCTVRAPYSGMVVSKDAQVGEVVSPISAGGGFTRTGIATIVDMDSLEIEVDVNESYIAKVTVGQTVDAVLDAYPEWHIPASVRTTIPTADRQKATVKVRIAFDKLDPRILPDMGVKVSFLGNNVSATATAAQALIPKEAVREIQGHQVVFQLQNNRLTQRQVTVGETRGTDMEILDGIAPGDTVVMHGPPLLRDGQKAEVK